ncbi:MAG: hypothetical protein D6706_07320 [Chloroflexi bacterium]|nr:MAG: hypothetical protein D6706_07320 [Chloroflexota bacterium]
MSETRDRRLLLWSGAVLTIVVIITGLALVQIEPEDETKINQTAVTLPFSHEVHTQKAEIDCLFCHSSALRAPQATLPSLNKCMICHSSITVEDDNARQNIEQLKQAYENGWRVQWPDVYRQPDFVYFSHRAHVNNGVSCQKCHGDVQNMTLVEKVVDMDMGFCLDCHQEQPEADIPRLIDCATCHK